MLSSLYIAAFLLAAYYYLKKRIIDYFSFNDRIKAFQTEKFQDTPEILDPVWRPVKGTLPPYLNGILYRIGPGKYNLGKFVINHAFDGMPFIHRLQVSSERQAVLYNSRNTAVAAERIIVQAPARTAGFFGHIQDLSAWERIMSIWNRLTCPIIPKACDPSSLMVGVTVSPNYPVPISWSNDVQTDNAKVLVAKTDLNALQLVHSDTLSPERLFSYKDYAANLSGELSAAHHQYDPMTGEVFNFTVSLFPVPKLVVFLMNRSGHVTVLAEISHRKLPGGRRAPISVPYIHSFWVTRRFVIIPESPLHYRPLDFLLRGAALGGMSWDQDAPAYLHVISRRPNIGHITTIPTNPFYTFHVGNAWDYADEYGNSVIMMDCCAFPDGDIFYQLHSFGNPKKASEVSATEPAALHPPDIIRSKPRGISMPPIRQPSFGDLRRYRLTFSVNDNRGTHPEASYCTIAKNVEFIRFSQKVAQLPYKYAWGCQLMPATREQGERYSLVKIDLDTGETLKFDQAGFTCSEPIFVPASSTDREDQGCLLSLVNIVDNVDPDKDRCGLLVLDASTMEQLAFCDIGPFKATTFHGSFVDDHYENVSIN